MPLVFVAALAAVPVIVGALVLRVRPRHRVGWLLVGHGVVFGLAFGVSVEGSAAMDQLMAGTWVLLFLGLVLIAYLLPDGHAASRGWRWFIRSGLFGAVLFLIGAAGDAGSFRRSHGGAMPPVPWLSAEVSGAFGLIGLLLIVALILGSVVAVGGRLHHARGQQRLQLLWLVWGSLTVPLALLAGWLNHFVLRDEVMPLFYSALGLSAVALPITIGIAVLRYQLFDIQVVLSRTLTYLSLAGAAVVVYALLLFGTDRLIGNDTISGLLGVGVLAVVVSPAHSWLRTRIERAVYGYRSAPHEALRLLADRAEEVDPEGLIASITATVAEALRVEMAWVETTSAVAAPAVRVPLVHRAERLGDLAVPVAPGRQLSPTDLALLKDLARHAAVLVRSEQLAAELRQSRARIVAAQEEERRRLRRDLHDGLGPSLAAIVLMLNAARCRTHTTQHDRLLEEATGEVKAAIAEVRRLVDDLRPPAIDEVGLLGAIRQRAAALSAEVAFEVAGPESMPPLPAAVEVAAFRIASEAMTNVARHSGARCARVRVNIDGDFELSVSDDGEGLLAVKQGGVGWHSMRERAAELGGSCTISVRPEGGLLVRAVLPLGQDATVETDA